MKKVTLVIICAIALTIAACQPVANTNQTSNVNGGNKSGWDAYVDQFLNDYFAANPTFAVIQGKHE